MRQEADGLHLWREVYSHNEPQVAAAHGGIQQILELCEIHRKPDASTKQPLYVLCTQERSFTLLASQATSHVKAGHNLHSETFAVLSSLSFGFSGTLSKLAGAGTNRTNIKRTPKSTFCRRHPSHALHFKKAGVDAIRMSAGDWFI